MDRFGPTGKVSKKRVHLLRWSPSPGRTGLNFGWMDRHLKVPIFLVLTHGARAQSPAVPSPPPSSRVFTLQLCSRNGYSVVRNFCGIKFPPVLESYIQTHLICFWLINVRKSFMTNLPRTAQDIFNSVKGLFTLRWGTLGRWGNLLCWGNPPVHTQISRFNFFTLTGYVG